MTQNDHHVAGSLWSIILGSWLIYVADILIALSPDGLEGVFITGFMYA